MVGESRATNYRPERFHQARFLKTLLPGGGPSTTRATFFVVVLALVFTFLVLFAEAATAATLPPLRIIVVPVEVADVLLVLLTDRVSVETLFTPRFGLVTAGLLIGLDTCGLLVLRLNALAFPRVDFVLLTITLTVFSAAAITADLAGVASFGGIIGFNGDAACERCGFCDRSCIECVGDWRRVRELDDLGESTVDGFGAWRDACPAAIFARFLGFGIGKLGSEAFSLPELSISSLHAKKVKLDS